jgi:hypothetical protein
MALTPSQSAALTAGGAAVGSLLGDKPSASSSTSSGVGENSSSSSRTISGAGGAARNASYDELVKLLTDDTFSKANAIKDSEGAVAELFKQYSITDLPKIFSSQISSGGYNSTGHQLLANDAFANTAAKGAALRSKAVLDYASARRNQLDPLISLLNNDFESSSSSYGYSLSNSNANGASAGGAGQGADLAAAGAAIISGL